MFGMMRLKLFTYATVRLLGALILVLPVRAAAPLTSLMADLTRSGALTADETWSGVVLVTGDVTVTAGVTLTILPGTVVRIATTDDQNGGIYPTKAELIVLGTILAQGTSAEPISFTSSSGTPAPGDWGCVRFQGAPPSSIISWSLIEYATNGISSESTSGTVLSYNTFTRNSDAAVGASFGSLLVIGNTITGNGGRGLSLCASNSNIDGNQISNNGGDGIHLLYYSSPTITHNTISNNAACGIYIESASYEALPPINFNTIVGNAQYGIFNGNCTDLDGTNNEWGTTDPAQIADAIYDFNDNPGLGLVALTGTTVTVEEHFSGNVTWSGTRVVNSHVWIDRGATLTVQAGAQIRFAGNYGLFNHGTLLVQGTSALPVVFTTDSVTPAPGAWGTIKFDHAEQSVVDYAHIEYASHGLFMWASSPTISNSSIVNSLQDGIVAVVGSSPNLINDTISDNGGHGLNTSVSADPKVTNTEISRNGGNGIFVGYYCSPIVSGSRVINNAGDGIFVCPWTYGTSTRVNYSSLHGNGGYAFRHNTGGNIDATHNYWGTTDPAAIAELIWDHNDEPWLGTVDFSGYVTDTTPPATTAELIPSPNASGWSNTDVVVTVSATDHPGGSGVKEIHYQADGSEVVVAGATASLSLSSEGIVAVKYWAVDSAANIEAKKTLTVQIDKTPPNPPLLSPDRMADYSGGGGWYEDSVTISFSTNGDSNLEDGSPGSGVDLSSVPGDLTFNSSGQHTASGAVKDVAGNESAAASLTVQVDADKPQVNISCPTGPVALGSSASTPWIAQDNESGLATPASGSIALDSSSVGPRTVAAPVATDNVGHNSDLVTCSYRVVYNFAGFFRPVDNLPTLNALKPGSAVPVKFSLSGDQGLGVLADGYPLSRRVACDATAPTVDIEQTVAAGYSSLSYDHIADQYIYVWKTDKTWVGTCRQLVIQLNDGMEYLASFTFAR